MPKKTAFNSLPLLLILSHLLSPCLAYVINVTPSTKFPAPRDTIDWEITPGTGDASVVNILLTSAARGNTTVVGDTTDLSKNSGKGSFDVPFVPPGNYFLRLLNASGNLLQDSSQFQIFAPGQTTIPTTSASTIPPTSSQTPPPNTTGSPSGDTTNNNNNSNTSQQNTNSKSSTPIGAIVGGVVGGIAAILVVLALIHFFVRPLCGSGRRKNNKYALRDAEKFDTEPSTKPRPFYTGHVPAPLSSPDSGESTHGADVLSPGVASTTLGSTATVANKYGGYGTSSKARLIQEEQERQRQQLQSSHRYDSSTDIGSSRYTVPISIGQSLDSTAGQAEPALPPGISRADYLRQERERINREIAMLEGYAGHGAASSAGGSYGTSSGSGGGGTSVYPPSSVDSAARSEREREIAAQLAALQEQIRAIEARQVQSVGQAADVEDAEPPPGYYPSPPSRTPEAGPASSSQGLGLGQEVRPVSVMVRSPLVDVKGPIAD
ncbi:hypothetical protein CPC08DRAFT_763943 [Agrocybe pediades]|nr:hypothetical protein CPC08DRAFT_763943 [Agrocybe pediades]